MINPDAIISTCQAVAHQLYPEEEGQRLERAHAEVELLRTKVRELCQLLNRIEMRAHDILS